MEQILKNKYIMKDHSQSTLHKLGFKKHPFDKDDVYYSFAFPVLKYNETASLHGEFIVDKDTGVLVVNVYDLKDKCYRPFYNVEYGNYDDILSIINKNILKQMKKFKISKKKAWNKKKRYIKRENRNAQNDNNK